MTVIAVTDVFAFQHTLYTVYNIKMLFIYLFIFACAPEHHVMELFEAGFHTSAMPENTSLKFLGGLKAFFTGCPTSLSCRNDDALLFLADFLVP